MMSEHCNVI